MNQQEREHFRLRLEQAAKGTFWEYLGCGIEVLTPEQVRVLLAVKPHHLNGIGILNGGVHASLLDNTMGIAAMAMRPDDKVVTNQLHLHYLSPVRLETIAVTAEIVHHTRSMITARGLLSGEDNRLCAYATASFRVLHN